MATTVAFRMSVTTGLQTVLGLRARITLVEPGSTERSMGKTTHVLDMRDPALLRAGFQEGIIACRFGLGSR